MYEKVQVGEQVGGAVRGAGAGGGGGRQQPKINQIRQASPEP